ncbi:AsmA family protein, partial [Pelomicrobium sp. G1]
LRLAGAGSGDIVNDTRDYLLKATVVATSKGQGGAELAQLKGITVPVRGTGPLAQPRYEFDCGAIAGDVAKRTRERE